MRLAFALAWRRALRRPRLLALNVGIPLLLVVPVAAGGAPRHHAAAVYAVLFVLFGTFGSAIPLLRDGEAGLLRRLRLAGLPPRRYLAGRAAATAAIDAIELLPAVAAILLLTPDLPTVTPAGALLLPAQLLLSLVAANALGAWVAGLARSVAEGALFSAVAALLALHLAGVFRTPAAESWAAAVEPAVPFTHLHELLLAVVAPATLAPAGVRLAVAAAGAGAALLVTGWSGRWVVDRLGGVG